MNLRKLAGLISPSWREPSTCEACGEAFACGAKLTGCWCTQVEVGEAVREDLRARYSRCLCRKCLESFARQEAVAESAKEV